MAKIKAVIATMVCGLAAISVNAHTDYSKNIPANANEITQAAWEKTGDVLRQSAKEMGGLL